MILKDKKILITGILTDKSIAFATAKIAIENGATVVATGFGKGLRITERAVKRLSEDIKVFEMDIENLNQVNQAVKNIGSAVEEVFEFKRNKTIIESLSGIKDIKILNIGRTFIRKFSQITKELAAINTNYITLSQFPRYLLELISVYGIFILMFVLIYQNQDSNYVITTLGVFVAGIFRLIPNINRIIVSLQNLRYSSPSLNSIIIELNQDIKYNMDNIIRTNNKLESSIVFRNINFNYDDKENIFEDLNIEIRKGEVIGISGESGSGKSTLADILLGLYKPNKGEIFLAIFTQLVLW